MDAEMKRYEGEDARFDSPSSYLDISLPEVAVKKVREERGEESFQKSSTLIQESVDEAFASNLRLLVKPKSSVVPKVIGVQYPELSETSQKSDGTLSASNALTVSLDTTTYTDRAVITIENNRGFDVYLTALSIHGRRVIRYPDALINDKLKRDDDIRRNGEKVLHVANNYIVNGTQVDKIADFWFKYYQSRKHIYSITIKGTAPWYEVGEWYQLSLGRADSNEYIDATVECYSVQCERTAGGIGTTVCMFREVLEGWAKTTLYTARAILGGSPARRTSRSNSVTVASSTFDGTYDYRCDGTADDVQIQAALDYLGNNGGGSLYLTEGNFDITNTITMRNNVKLSGSGIESTKIRYSSGTFDRYIDCPTGVDNWTISDLSIDGQSATKSHSTRSIIYGITGDNQYQSSISRVKVADIKNTYASGACEVRAIAAIYNASCCFVEGIEAVSSAAYSAKATAFYGCIDMTSCNATGSIATSGTGGIAYATGFGFCSSMNNCLSKNHVSSGPTTRINSLEMCYDSCDKITNCKADNAGTASNYAFGFASCTWVQQCTAINGYTNYSGSSADAGANACAATAAGGYNS